MTPEILRHLRESRGLTREQLADHLGDCSPSTVNKWERGMHDIPAWVEEKMLRAIEVKLPLDELHLLLSEAQSTGLPADQIIADALRLWLKTQRQEKSPSQTGADLVKPPAWTPPTSRVQTVASTSHSRASASAEEIANIVKLPPQHVVSLNESAQTAPIPARDETLGAFSKPARKSPAKKRTP